MSVVGRTLIRRLSPFRTRATLDVMPSSTVPAAAHAPQSVHRWLATNFPGASPVQGELPLELSNVDPPRVTSAAILEGASLVARAVIGERVATFAAFLDGRQASDTTIYRLGGVPIVFGTVGAVVRERRDQRLFTWRHSVQRAFYASRRQLSSSDWLTLESSPWPVRDIDDPKSDMPAAEHPLALREAAVHRVQEDREDLEQQLARDWVAGQHRPLLIDGGISDDETVARSSFAIGVVKSHRTFYAKGDALTTVLGLRPGERSSVLRVSSARRTPVASWYLRLRDWAGHDPMWGLVRIEAALPRAEDDIIARADEVSRWILAEAHPVALPDSRWDKMVYGVRDCEEFLRAVM